VSNDGIEIRGCHVLQWSADSRLQRRVQFCRRHHRSSVCWWVCCCNLQV